MKRSGRQLTREVTGNLVAWLRLIKGYDLVSTESGFSWKADILALGKELIEIEVKISIADLKSEITNDKKKTKHKVYRNGTIRKDQFAPDRYYFCVPVEMKDETVEFVKKLNPKYGVIVFTQNKDVTKLKRLKAVKYNLKICKPAKMLQDKMADVEKIKSIMIKRVTMELAALKCKKEIIDRD